MLEETSSHNFLGDDTKPSIEHWSNSFSNNALGMGIDQIPTQSIDLNLINLNNCWETLPLM